MGLLPRAFNGTSAAECGVERTVYRLTMIHERDNRRQRRLSWLQLFAGAFTFGPLVAVAHSYAAHESARVSIVAWVMHAFIIGIVWGPLLTSAGAALLLIRRAQDAALALSLCGAAQSAILYSIVVFIRTAKLAAQRHLKS